MERRQGVRFYGSWCSLVVAATLLAASNAAAQRPAPPPGWLERLPSVSAVRSAVHGSDPADTAARQEAALCVMMDVIVGLTGVPHAEAGTGTLPQPAGARWLEYVRAKSTGRPTTTPSSPAAGHYYGNLTFYKGILSKLLPPDVESAYEASGRYQELGMLRPPPLLADEPDPGRPDCSKVLTLIAQGQVEEGAPVTRHCDQESMRAAFAARDSQVKDGQYRECLQAQKLMANGLAANAAPLQMKCDEKRRHAAEGAAQLAEQERRQRIQSGRGVANAPEKTLRLLERDKKDARNGHVSLTVFGVQLGEPLQLSSCTDENSGEYCVTTTDSSMVQAANLLQAFSGVDIPGLPAGNPVRLPRSKCPRWIVGCTAYLDMQDGVAVGVLVHTSAWTSEQVKTVDDALKEKYGGRVVKGDILHSCANTLTGVTTDEAYDRQWPVPGLRVVYSPIVECNSHLGVVSVKFRAVQEQTEKRKRDSEPKM